MFFFRWHCSCMHECCHRCALTVRQHNLTIRNRFNFNRSNRHLTLKRVVHVQYMFSLLLCLRTISVNVVRTIVDLSSFVSFRNHTDASRSARASSTQFWMITTFQCWQRTRDASAIFIDSYFFSIRMKGTRKKKCGKWCFYHFNVVGSGCQWNRIQIPSNKNRQFGHRYQSSIQWPCMRLTTTRFFFFSLFSSLLDFGAAKLFIKII